MRNAASHEKRCSWVNMNDPLLVEYHDHEWGVPVHGDNQHLEVLVLWGTGRTELVARSQETR